jgi:radical SAM protein with 4Fe4S-binding SPASM domain
MLKFCNSSFTTVAIHANGDVAPCLCKGWHTYGPVGNLHENSLEEIFNNEKMQKFRETIYDQSFKFCKKNTCGKLWNLDQVENFDHVKIPKLPTTIFFQNLDYSCNLKCPSCRLEPIYSKEINPDAKFILDTIKKEYQDFDQSVMICGDGQGEMFASSAYLEFFNALDLPRCFRLATNTNGNLLLKRMDLLTKLHQQNQIAAIAVCFDATNAKTYKKIRGGRFDLVTRGVEEVIAQGMNVTAQMVVQYENYQEILTYRDMCLEFGVTHMGLQRIQRWQHMPEIWWELNNIDNNPDVDYDFLIPALQEFKKTKNAGICGGLENLINIKQSLIN